MGIRYYKPTTPDNGRRAHIIAAGRLSPIGAIEGEGQECEARRGQVRLDRCELGTDRGRAGADDSGGERQAAQDRRGDGASCRQRADLCPCCVRFGVHPAFARPRFPTTGVVRSMGHPASISLRRSGRSVPFTLNIRLPVGLCPRVLDELFTQCDDLALGQLCAATTKRGPDSSHERTSVEGSPASRNREVREVFHAASRARGGPLLRPSRRQWFQCSRSAVSG